MYSEQRRYVEDGLADFIIIKDDRIVLNKYKLVLTADGIYRDKHTYYLYEIIDK